MKVTIKEKNGLKITYLIEREQQGYNNIVETAIISEQEVNGLSDNEILTLGFTKLRPLAVRVFEAIEPISESDHAEGFELVPSREVRKEVLGNNPVYLNEASVALVNSIDQYGQLMASRVVTLDTSKLCDIVVDGRTFNVVRKDPTPEDYIVDLDFRLSKIELGV